MIKSLIGKELAEHWASMILISLFMCLGFMIVLSMIMFATDGGRPLEALRSFLMTFVILTSLILGNRLVVKEYQSQTQLFLEALPLTRLGMITTKYVFGLLVILLPTLTMFGLVALMSQRIDDLTPRFLAILVSKTVAFASLAYSFFFLMGLLGRYRVAIYILIVILAFVLDNFTQLELQRFAPFALVDSRFAYERQIFPTQDLLVTASLIAGCVLMIGLLTVVREGNVASMLAEKMSYREKIVMTCLIFGVLACLTVFDERIFKRPFDLPNSLIAKSEITDVKITDPGSDRNGKAQRLVDTVANEVTELASYLDVKNLPPIFLVHRSDLDFDQFERGNLENADGVLVRANFYHDDWNSQEFLSWFAKELINATSQDRNMTESVRWVLDGFPFFWANKRGYIHSGADAYKRDVRVAYAMKKGFSKDDFSQWLTYRERVGRDIAEAMAWNGLESIKSRTSENQIRRFLQRILDPDVPSDIRSTVHIYTNSVRRVAKQELKLNDSDIFELWVARAKEVMNSHDAALEKIPELNGSVKYEKISTGSRKVSFEFDCVPPPEDGKFFVKYTELPLFDFEIAKSDEQVETLFYDKHNRSSLGPTFSRRSRFMYTFAVFSDVLGCELISGWRREEMP